MTKPTPEALKRLAVYLKKGTAESSAVERLRVQLVNDRLKLRENQRFEIGMTVWPARSFECPRRSSATGLRRRSLGGKRGPGDSPLSRPQPPEAGAEGQSLQGTITRPRSVTQSDDRLCLCRDAQRGRKMSGQFL